MHKFYVIFKNQDSIEGTTTMPSDEFSRKIIQPNVDDIYTFQFWDEEENETSDFDVVDYINTPEEENDWWPENDDRESWENEEESVVYDHILVSTAIDYQETIIVPTDSSANSFDTVALIYDDNAGSKDHTSFLANKDITDYEFVRVLLDGDCSFITLWKKK